MRSDTLITVMAHREAQETFNRHVPYWTAHRQDMLVMCPTDSMVRTSLPTVALGKASHHGAMANRRFRQLLEALERTNYPNFVIFEYDALCLDRELAFGSHNEITSNLWKNTQPERFKGSQYLHPPLSFSREALSRINQAADRVADHEEGGAWDRWLGYVCDLGKIPTRSWNGLGFSRNTIEFSDIPAAVAARKAGACMFHGVKTVEALYCLTHA